MLCALCSESFLEILSSCLGPLEPDESPGVVPVCKKVPIVSISRTSQVGAKLEFLSIIAISLKVSTRRLFDL